MELKAIVLMIIKIVISIPTIVMLTTARAHGATLMGGHIDNRGDSSSLNRTNFILEEIDQSALKESLSRKKDLADPSKDDPESIPDPSPLVVPGYNLPDNIFNKGKPFYLEKNPVTGELNFPVDAQASPDDEYQEYEYEEDEPASTNIFDKSNIDRKDGHIGSHKPNDVNQLTPNFHDFLNLPVKYSSDKYVYPLISSSYANTKVQGNINRYHNHKDYTVTTYKPTKNPTYMATKYSYFDQRMTTTTPRYTTRTTKPTTQIYLTTTEDDNLMNSPMNHHSFEDYTSTEKTKVDDIFLTTTPSSETKRPLSLFEQIFGSYDEMAPTTKKAEQVDDYDINGHAGPYNPNVLTGSNMGAHYQDDYEDDVTDNIAVENQQQTQVYTKPTTKITTTTQATTTPPSTTTQISTTEAPTTIKISTITPRPTTRQTTTQTPTTTRRTTTTTPRPTTTTTTTIKPTRKQENPRPTTYSPKVTSMPLGEFYSNQQQSNPQQIIVSTQHLRDQLNNEKVVPRPFERPQNLAPSSSNIIVPADQNTVSFVVGNQQNVGNDYVGFKESPFDNKPFRPLFQQEEYPQDTYSQEQFPQDKYPQDKYPQENYPQDNYAQDTASYHVGTSINLNKENKPFNIGASSIMHPIRNSETSLAIGVPVQMVKKPGQVVDDPEIQNAQIEFPKGNGPKIVFPEDDKTDQPTIKDIHRQEVHRQEIQRQDPPMNTTPQNLRLKYNMNQMNKEILKLSSKPMLHQLPSDLTPPSETVTRIHQQGFINRDRPPWDPRPGHFHSGRPEYARPPRPNEVYKRADNLPNILPQFRPNAKPPHYFDHHPNKGYLRQPLLERPSNRPIGFFEKLQPPPLPKQHQMNHNLRKGPPPQFDQQNQHFQQQNKIQQELKPRHPIAEDRIMNEGYKKPSTTPEYAFYQTPPKVVLAQRRNGDADVAEVATLQMLQAKKDKPEEDGGDEEVFISSSSEAEIHHFEEKDKNEKPIFVVYPVNSGPMKLDVLDSNKKETVVIGKRAELPLPPSQIQDFDQDSSKPFDFNLHERHDSPILKPHPKPNYPSKTDFPYPLERPDPSLLSAPEVPNTIDNNPKFESNSWDSLDDTQARIVTDTKGQGQISVKLKTYTEKPIAVAYTPTEPHRTADKYSLPNYASPVIPEIRNPEDGSEITVGAVMNTQKIDQEKLYNHVIKTEDDDSRLPQLDFQAPFQASVNVDNMSNNGWSVVRERNRQGDDVETTTQPLITTNKFDIENFNPPLIGGFKPIYNYPDDDSSAKETEIKERQE